MLQLAIGQPVGSEHAGLTIQTLLDEFLQLVAPQVDGAFAFNTTSRESA